MHAVHHEIMLWNFKRKVDLHWGWKINSLSQLNSGIQPKISLIFGLIGCGTQKCYVLLYSPRACVITYSVPFKFLVQQNCWKILFLFKLCLEECQEVKKAVFRKIALLVLIVTTKSSFVNIYKFSELCALY